LAVAAVLDNGYPDNDQVAPAILDRRVPASFCVYLDAVEMSEMPWRSRLRHAFLTTRRKGWNDQHGGTWLLGWNDRHEGSWPLESQQHREEAFLKACDFCAALFGNLQEQFLLAIEAELDVARDRAGLMYLPKLDQEQSAPGVIPIVHSSLRSRCRNLPHRASLKPDFA
jgi:hypothetical protein